MDALRAGPGRLHAPTRRDHELAVTRRAHTASRLRLLITEYEAAAVAAETGPPAAAATTTSTSSSSTRCSMGLADDFAPCARRPDAALDAAGRDRPSADPGAVPPARLDLQRRAHRVRAQALRVAVARGQQGDEPQRLHRADGRPAHEEQTPTGVVLRARPARGAGRPRRPGRRRTCSRSTPTRILLRDYCLRLVYFLEQPENERVAVTQTPYSSFRGAPTRIERLAGATTDLQHILHQGMTLLRRNLLGRRQRRHPQAGPRRHRRGGDASAGSRSAATSRTARSSRTPSPASTSATHGWTLLNYPERLSYSATPPDFGSLSSSAGGGPTAAC